MGFIKNFDSLASTPERKTLLELVETAFASIQPHAVMDTQFKLENNILTIADQTYELNNYERIHLLGFGKGSAEVCRIIEDKLGDKLTQGFDIDVVDEKPFAKIQYTKGTHPLPSQENIDFTANVLNKLSGMTEKDLVLVVICGGGSVLFEQPHTVNLEKLIEIVKAMLKSGATISEMNVIRKHLSNVKGGGLAKHLYPATVASVIFSDVPGNDLSVIASAPTVKDPTTMDDVQRILEQFKVRETVQIEDNYFVDTAHEDKYFEHVSNILIVSNDSALKAMQQKAQELGYDAEIITDKFQSDAKEAGKKLLDQSKPGKISLFGGETTVHVKGNGQGGRNQTLVLASLPYIDNNTSIVSFDSDGWDFTTLAGALGDSATKQKVEEQGINMQEYLDNDDSLGFFQKIGDGIDTGKLESNVSDLMIVWKR